MKLLTYEQAAATLAVSVKSVRRMVGRGELPRVSVGGRAVRIQEADLLRYVERRTVK